MKKRNFILQIKGELGWYTIKRFYHKTQLLDFLEKYFNPCYENPILRVVHKKCLK